MKFVDWMRRLPWGGITAWVALGAIAASAISILCCWDWLSKGEPNSSTIRNIVLAAAAAIALPLAMWRSTVAERQADTARRQSETAERGLLNERYQKGAEMLGSAVLSVRLGGIYTLQRLAEEHPEQYHVQIMRLFCAFVRNPIEDNNAQKDQPSDILPNLTELRTDVQAVMDAIGARGESGLKLEKEAEYKPDLRLVELRRASLQKANLSDARLSWADLTGAALGEANLSNAILNQADLTGTTLGGTKLSGASLNRATLQSATFWTLPGTLRFIKYHNALLQGKVLTADLSSAKLDGSDLSGASLQGADLSGSYLTDAILSGANLSNANLSGATLVRANLSNVILAHDGEKPVTGLTQNQLDQACADPNNPPKLGGVVFDAETGKTLVWRGKSPPFSR